MNFIHCASSACPKWGYFVKTKFSSFTKIRYCYTLWKKSTPNTQIYPQQTPKALSVASLKINELQLWKKAEKLIFGPFFCVCFIRHEFLSLRETQSCHANLILGPCYLPYNTYSRSIYRKPPFLREKGGSLGEILSFRIFWATNGQTKMAKTSL